MSMTKEKNNNKDLEIILAESLKNKLKEDLEKEFESIKVDESLIPRRRNMLRVGLISFLLVVLVIVSYFMLFRRTSNYDMALKFLNETELSYGENITRNIEDTGRETTSILSIDNLTKLSNHEKMQLGISLMKDNNSLVLADSIFQTIKNESSGLKVEKLWLMGLCQILLGNEGLAKEHFSDLAELSKFKEKERKILIKNIK